jgi:hypothetical protein
MRVEGEKRTLEQRIVRASDDADVPPKGVAPSTTRAGAKSKHCEKADLSADKAEH